MTTKQDKSEQEFSRIAAFFDERAQRYGSDLNALDYAHRNAQLIRFEAISQVLDFSNSSVLDVGCGFGEFADYLESKFDAVAYEGVDLSTRIIEEAKRRRPDLRVSARNILDPSFDGTYDVVTAVGIFYLLDDHAVSIMHSLIERMFAMCRKAVAFSTLSSWAPFQEGTEFHADPLETIAYCHELTPNVALRHDYHFRDFTIYMYREPR